MLHRAWLRFAIAGTVSLLLHAIVLWTPRITVAHNEPPLPLLSAKLIPLPKLPPRPAHHSSSAQRPAPPPRPAALPPKPTAAPASAVAAASAVAPASAPVAASAVVAAPAASAVLAEAAAESTMPPAPDYAATSSHAPPLPRRARLTFVAQLGTGGIYVGEVRHELEIVDDRYTVRAELETTGLASLFKRYRNVQEGRGTVSAQHGLHPDRFTESKTDEHGTQRSEADFDWNAHEIRFASGEKAKLPDGAQDVLSFLYQLSQLPFNREIIPLAVSNGRKLEYYELETGTQETIETPMGKLRALHLKKLHKPGEEGLEVWLGMEYRLLPVKLRQIERDGKVGGEILVTEIRVSDE